MLPKLQICRIIPNEVLKQISSGRYECFLMYFVESYLKSTNNVKNILYSLGSYVCRRNVINFTNSTPFSQAFHYCDFHVEVKVGTETQFLNLYFILRLHISYSFLKFILAVSLGKQSKSCACSCLRKNLGCIYQNQAKVTYLSECYHSFESIL